MYSQKTKFLNSWWSLVVCLTLTSLLYVVFQPLVNKYYWGTHESAPAPNVIVPDR
jgi:hypothetical protein